MSIGRRYSEGAYKQSRSVLSVLVMLCGLGIANSALGFDPNTEDGHMGIARDGVDTDEVSHTTAAGNTIRFTERALMDIRMAAALVDLFDMNVTAAHCDDEQLQACSNRIGNLRDRVISNLSDDGRRNGAYARDLTGRALHTVHDFYSHSNWVDLGYAGVNSNLGSSNVGPVAGPHEATCADDHATLAGAGLTRLTSGYWSWTNDVPRGKCSHGLEKLGVEFFPGINKDFQGRPNFEAARAAAVQATADYVNSILTAAGVSGNDIAVMEYMAASGSIGFVIDDTGSMGAEIAGVKQIVQRIIETTEMYRERGIVVPTNYLMLRYGDPDVGSPYLTKDPNALLASVNALYPHGGGDCPELAQTALLRAVQAGEVRSNLYFFSDASSKDRSLAGRVEATANAKKTRIHYLLTGSCSPIDPAYIKVAQNTGGQVFVVSPYELANLYPIIEPSLKGDQESLLVAQDTLAGTPTDYAVPVDSTVSSLTVSVTSESLSSVLLYRPDGIPVNGSDPDVAESSVSRGRIYTVSAPAAGVWRLEVNGYGDVSVSVLGNSDISFYDFAFLAEGGRPGDSGLFPISGQPVASDEPQLARAFMLGSIADARFELRGLDGSLLGYAALLPGGEDPEGRAPVDAHFGSLLLPSVPFRVYAVGTDATGLAYQRAFAPVFQVRGVSVEPNQPGLTVAPGGEYATTLAVTNHGNSSATFSVAASATVGSVTSVSPQSLTLEAGATGELLLRGTVPGDTEIGAEGAIAVEVSAGTEAFTNTAVIRLRVEGSLAVEALIDIKPDDDENTLNLRGGGVIPVAIFGGDTMSGHGYDLDVTDIDIASLRLADATVRARGSKGPDGIIRDVNGDGMVDLLVHFEVNELAVGSDATRLDLEGVIRDGRKLVGSDAVRIVPDGHGLR